MVTMMITVYYRAHRILDENVFGREQNQKAFRQLLSLVAYPILFCVLVIPTMISRVYEFASPTPNKGLTLLLAIFVPLWNGLAGLTLFIHIGVLKRAEIMHFVLRARGKAIHRRESSTPRDITGFLESNSNGTRSSTYFSVPTTVAISNSLIH